MTAILHTRSGAHDLVLRCASDFLARLRGWMLSAPPCHDQGLLITRCAGVHSAFMRYAIDVVYLDAAGTVVRCRPRLEPWRASMGGARARHTLELGVGGIARLAIEPGDKLDHPYFQHAATPVPSGPHTRQRGSAMMEFTVVGPLTTLFGLALLQYGMLFFAKNQINHAAFMAARAGSTGNASLEAVRLAYARALVPMYGGGQTSAELAAAYAKASADIATNLRIEILNPTKESFDDWNSPELQKRLGSGAKRVIPNSNQAFRTEGAGAASGQTIQDANLLKLRITQGYAPKVPIIASIYKTYLKWQDSRNDAFHTAMVDDGRIPVVTSVTLHMQSDAVEGDAISSPGKGNEGKPVDPGDPPYAGGAEPTCATIACHESPPAPTDPPVTSPPTPSDPGTPCTGSDCPACSGA